MKTNIPLAHGLPRPVAVAEVAISIAHDGSSQ